ncbi:MAG: hypothetical protein Kow0025_06970 [Thermodesulfovibrionales bacterium]
MGNIIKTRDGAIRAIEHNARVINLIVLLVIFIILLVIVRFIYSVLDYLPMQSVVAILALLAGLMIIATSLVQSISNKGVKALNLYVQELDALTEAMQEKEKKYSSLFENSSDGIYIQDSGGNILDANQKILDMFGAAKEEFLGLRIFDIYSPDTLEKSMHALHKIFNSGSHNYETAFLRRTGEVFPVEVSSSLIEIDGRKVIQNIVRDITERKKAEEKLRSLSVTDDLTGLLNRRGFMTLAKQQIKIADRSRRGMFLMFVDIDDLKQVNDTFGHHEGDRVVRDVAALLKGNVRDSDITARLGGDEFAVLMVDIAEAVDGSVILNRLNARLAALNNEKGRNCKISLSAGIARYDPEEAISLEDLIVLADRSMYENKKDKLAGSA